MQLQAGAQAESRGFDFRGGWTQKDQPVRAQDGANRPSVGREEKEDRAAFGQR